MSRLGMQSSIDFDSRAQGCKVVAMGCKLVGGGSDGTLDLCARVCLTDEDEKIIFHTYVKPQIPVTYYRSEATGIRAEYLRDAMPLRQAQRKIQDFLCNGNGKAMILVGHGLDHELQCLGVEYPSFLIRDTATYPPLMKTNKLSNSLKYLAQAYLGYDIQNGVQDPYEDCVAASRLYERMRSQAHPRLGYSTDNINAQNRNDIDINININININNFGGAWKQTDLERMTPEALLEISASDYYCWCLDEA